MSVRAESEHSPSTPIIFRIRDMGVVWRVTGYSRDEREIYHADFWGDGAESMAWAYVRLMGNGEASA
jgi:hypothetical protein